MVDVVGTLFDLHQLKEVTMPAMGVFLIEIAADDTVAQRPRDNPARTACVSSAVESIKRWHGCSSTSSQLVLPFPARLTTTAHVFPAVGLVCAHFVSQAASLPKVRNPIMPQISPYMWGYSTDGRRKGR